MTLVQIGLPRDRAQAPTHAAESGQHPSASLSSEVAEGELAVDDDDTDPGHSLAASSSGLVLAGGLVLLAPLVLLVPAHRGALALLLIGLGALALIAVLVRAARVTPA